MSDGGRERAPLGMEVWKSSQKWSAQRSAVRSIAWLGVMVELARGEHPAKNSPARPANKCACKGQNGIKNEKDNTNRPERRWRPKNDSGSENDELTK